MGAAHHCSQNSLQKGPAQSLANDDVNQTRKASVHTERYDRNLVLSWDSVGRVNQT